jgi:hypothetical protein
LVAPGRSWQAVNAAEHFVGWSDDGVNSYGYYFSISAPGAYTYNLGKYTARYTGVQRCTHAPCCGNFSFKETEVYLTYVLSGETTLEAAPISDLVSLKLDSK